MIYEKLNQKKGVAGINVLLAVVVMIFLIGLVTMIFVITGSELQEANLEDNVAGSATNETVTSVTETAQNLANSGLDDVSCTFTEAYGNLTDLLNETTDVLFTSSCTIAWNATTGNSTYNNTDWLVSYTFTYTADTTGAGAVMNDTSTALGGVTDWFSIIIVLTVVVVLVLLVVLIISSVRGSGFLGKGGA